MKHKFILILLLIPQLAHAVGDIVPGQSLWCIDKSIGSTVDVLLSKVCTIDASMLDMDTSLLETLVVSKIDIITEHAVRAESKLCTSLSVVDLLAVCLSTAITGPTTINTPGIYCVANPISGPIVVNASDVELGLNNHEVAGGVSVTSNQSNIAIQNGFITNTSGDALKVNSGVSNINVSHVTAKDALRGISFEEVSGGLISNCEFTFNVTGVELNKSNKIVIENSTASCNTNAGFCLLSSTTNCVRDCKSLVTGGGNTQTSNQTIFGFVATDGNANIFERCIANGTQALFTTDFDSLVAGFALRGSESCTKIIDSESATATTNGDGVTIPYGILLEGTLSTQLTLTGRANDSLLNNPLSSNWDKSGKFIAVADSGIPDILIYEYDRTTNIVPRIARANDSLLAFPRSAEWSPDGTLVAVADSTISDVLVYEFEKINNSLTRVARANDLGSRIARSSNWDPTGKFLAVGGSLSGSPGFLRVYAYDRVNNSLASVDTIDVGATSNIVISSNWSPDGKHILVSIERSGSSDLIAVYRFENNILTQVTTANILGNSPTINPAEWSPDGKYVAVSFRDTLFNPFLRVYQFDSASESLTFLATISLSVPQSSVWSPDGKYIATVDSSTNRLTVREFDRSNNTLTVASNSQNILSNPLSSEWSPDGGLIAVVDSTLDNLLVFEAIQFPSKNVIKNNTVYCNSGNTCPGGVGISGSSITNLIIGNTAYSNPVPQDLNKPIVSSNYQFVTNVFNQLFGQAPTALQNISVDGCDPICMPDDVPLILKQSLKKLCNVESQLPIIESKIDTLEVVSPCDPTTITANTTLSSGIYCLANNSVTSIVIDGNDVVLSLNNHVVKGNISSSNRNQITIRNGTVDATSGNPISFTNAQDIVLQDVHVKNGEVGINLNHVTGGLVERCTFSSNTTGIELDHSHNIALESCNANCNTNAGFCLLSSTTNCLRDCKAVSTGEGNTQAVNQTIFGFVSNNGTGNIFERCIANGTQGLSVTDFDSLIANFVFRGSESCSKIIDSESANATTNVEGVTVPYGILLEATINSTLTLTGRANDSILSDPRSSNWSSDGKLISVADANGSDMLIYQYDRTSNVMTRIARTNDTLLIFPRSSEWNPDGVFISVADSSLRDVLIYEFDKTNNTLTRVARANDLGSRSPRSSSWNTRGNYMAVGGALSVSPGFLRVYSFDPVNKTLTLLDTAVVGSVSEVVISSKWHPDGKHIVISVSSPGTGDFIQVYRFENNTLTQVATTVIAGTDPNISPAEWSPDGKYIAVAKDDGGSSLLRVFEFNSAAGTITGVSSVSVSSPQTSVWSPDGKYISVADDSNGLEVYTFNRSTNTLSLAANSSISLSNPFSSEWSPDGGLIAVADGTLNNIFVYDALNFPSKNVIKNNTVYCNSGNRCPGGVGISGSSITNLIIGNTAYSNPVPQGINKPIVSSNYQFVTNIFNQLFGQEPTALQNISLDGCEPICMPDDLPLILEQDLKKICDIESKIAILATIVDPLVFLEDSCVSTPITANTTLSSGIYCLSNNTVTSIVIDGNDVVLDLNNHVVKGNISSSNRNQITIRNGVVNATSGDPISFTNAQDIILQDVHVKNGEVGINLNHVTGGIVERCTFSSNTTGIELDHSHNIVLESCNANCNTNAGFCLLSSTTNCLRDCKSVSTGQGNTQIINQTIFGFVSTDGAGNIFERCIANSTQALSTTDANSLVANFALRGSESCSKIIDSESANATTSVEGVTVPYGILLEASLNNLITLTGVPPIPIPGANVTSVNWSSDGKFLATGINNLDGQGIRVYQLDRVNETLTQVATPNVIPDDSVRSVNWSPDGKFLAAGINIGDAQRIRVYAFDRGNNTLTQVATPNIIPDAAVRSVNWSPDGKFLAVGIGVGDAQRIRVYAFDRGNNTLTQVATPNDIPDAGVRSVNWSPDGKFLAIGTNTGDAQRIRVYDALSFPSKNVIKNNTVYCNSGNKCPGGIGISGSSISNLIIQNTVYASPLNPPSVSTNYQFVTNVYNQLFSLGQGPTVLQNISVPCDQPICTPDNMASLLKRIDAKVDTLGCGKIALTSNNIVGGTISITESGAYCVATDLTTDIIISTTCASLDLNNRIITGLITVQEGIDNDIINGTVSAPAPTTSGQAAQAVITINDATVRSRIENVTIRTVDTSTADVAGRAGVHIQGDDAQIKNCIIFSGAAGNSTGSDAPAGGHGIVVNGNADRALIETCLVTTGAGGDSSVSRGGDGGNGIQVTGESTETKIIGNTIFATGAGGAGAGSDSGGIGGHGINITENARTTMVTESIIRNTGVSGSPESMIDIPLEAGGTVSVPLRSRAINDLISTNANGISAIFSNIAYNVFDDNRPFIFQSALDTLNQGNAAELPPLPNEKSGTVVTGWSTISNVVFQSAIEELSP